MQQPASALPAHGPEGHRSAGGRAPGQEAATAQAVIVLVPSLEIPHSCWLLPVQTASL